MSSTNLKIKRLEPVIKAKKVIMEKESIKLRMLQTKKTQVQTEMEEFKGNYVMGVQNLNILRQSEDRKALSALEACVDSCKERWTTLFRHSQILEKEIQLQREVLNTAQKKLKAAENLQEKLKTTFAKELSLQEQKTQDDLSIYRHYKNER